MIPDEPSPRQENVDDRLGGSLKVLVVLQITISRIASQQLRQRQTGACEHSDRKKSSTVEAIKVAGIAAVGHSKSPREQEYEFVLESSAN